MTREIKGRRFITAHEAAKRLGLHPWTLLRKTKGKKQNGFELRFTNDPLTNRIYFLENDIEEIINKMLRDVEKKRK